VIYFDASYLVRLYYQDAGAEAARALAATDHVACAANAHSNVAVESFSHRGLITTVN
jgi:hypothetical protein